MDGRCHGKAAVFFMSPECHRHKLPKLKVLRACTGATPDEEAQSKDGMKQAVAFSQQVAMHRFLLTAYLRVVIVNVPLEETGASQQGQLIIII